MFEHILQRISDYSFWILSSWQKWNEEKKLGALRSPLWSKTKKEFAKLYPKRCSIIACKETILCELHHLLPFNKRPDLENDFNNLRWFCRRHHFEVAHLFSWRSYCEELEKIIELINDRIINKPK